MPVRRVGLPFCELGVPVEDGRHGVGVGVFYLGVDEEALAVFGYVVADLLGRGEEFAGVGLE